MIKLTDGSLRMLDLEDLDLGDYECRASNQWGTDTRTTHLIRVSKPTIRSTTVDVDDFESMDLTVTVGSHVRARLGARVVIKCPTKGYL